MLLLVYLYTPSGLPLTLECFSPRSESTGLPVAPCTAPCDGKLLCWIVFESFTYRYFAASDSGDSSRSRHACDARPPLAAAQREPWSHLRPTQHLDAEIPQDARHFPNKAPTSFRQGEAVQTNRRGRFHCAECSTSVMSSVMNCTRLTALVCFLSSAFSVHT